MRVIVDTDACASAGLCALRLPQVFDQREADGVVVLRTPIPPEEYEDDVREAAIVCPGRAIQIKED